MPEWLKPVLFVVWIMSGLLLVFLGAIADGLKDVAKAIRERGGPDA